MTDKNKQVAALNEVGQSVWYDNLSRDVLESGELAALIDKGVSGLTSNPTIFQKAISSSDKYDESAKSILQDSVDDEELCEALMIEDVANAADLLLPIYEESKGADGYASIEVSPYLANDTPGTVQAAKRIWKSLNRPNIMIKVPATSEGIPAIEDILADGINVNVTLIFSSEVYRSVVQAYMKALQRRKAVNKDISKVTSVASFFVSRVDAIVEKNLASLLSDGQVDQKQADMIIGKIGIANSKVAYAAYEEIFVSVREFQSLKASGAKVQRPLWASTGTKNPAFSKVLYIEELAGKDTVNTLPPATLDALIAGADIEPRLHDGLDEARACIETAKSVGIPFDDLLLQLQKDGVRSFADSYTELLEAIAGMRQRVQG